MNLDNGVGGLMDGNNGFQYRVTGAGGGGGAGGGSGGNTGPGEGAAYRGATSGPTGDTNNTNGSVNTSALSNVMTKIWLLTVLPKDNWNRKECFQVIDESQTTDFPQKTGHFRDGLKK